jgi:predicted nucleic acid-binding protein
MSEAGLVFDTEPLVAYIRDEPGANEVKEHLDRVGDGSVEGFVSPVTLTEVDESVERYNRSQEMIEKCGRGVTEDRRRLGFVRRAFRTHLGFLLHPGTVDGGSGRSVLVRPGRTDPDRGYTAAL